MGRTVIGACWQSASTSVLPVSSLSVRTARAAAARGGGAQQSRWIDRVSAGETIESCSRTRRGV
eukprot:4106107-Prymnesium_polylepis.2